ncbi:reverse transcriptase domain-containing protein [Tanacetum coccineum]
MSKSAERAQMPANSVIRNTAGKGSKQATEGPQGFLLEDRLREICEKHYNQILPIMIEKVHQEKLQGVQTRLTYSESSRQKAQTKEKTQLSESESCDRKRRTKKRLRQEESSSTRQRSPVSTTVFTRLGARDRNVFTRPREKKRDIYSQLGTKVASRHKHASNRIRASSGSPKKSRIPNYVKTYDGTRYPEDHLKIFQTSAKIERWAMPTWCHIFNSILIGSAIVWFDKLPPESIDSYEVLRKAFLGNFTQQKKYIKDPMEIYHIKQREGESTEAFMERFKAESIHGNGAPECMRISGFMHGITNLDLIKRLNDNIPKSVDEMMSVTTAFLRGEAVVANQSRKKALPI